MLLMYLTFFSQRSVMLSAMETIEQTVLEKALQKEGKNVAGY